MKNNQRKILILFITFSMNLLNLFASDQKALLNQIVFKQNIGAILDPNLSFTNERGQRIKIKEIINDRPSIFVFSYTHCKTLCPLVINSLVLELRRLNSKSVNYNIIFLSIDPKETIIDLIERKKLVQHIYNRSVDTIKWHILKGQESEIKKAASILGFVYRFDKETEQYAHPAGLIFLTPKGIVSSYLLGLNYKASDIESALKIASEGFRGNLVEAILLYCFHYDPTNGRYGEIIIRLLRIAAFITLFSLVITLFHLNRSKTL